MKTRKKKLSVKEGPFYLSVQDFYSLKLEEETKGENILAVRQNNYVRLMCNISKPNGYDN